MEKTRISYTDADGQIRILSISNDLLPFYDKWRKTKEEVESGKWNGANRQKAYDCMEKCLAKFTYQTAKDECVTCECGATVPRCNLARHRATPKHANALKALTEGPKYKKEEQKEPIAETEKLCECGLVVSKSGYARHRATPKHAKQLESMIEEPNDATPAVPAPPLAITDKMCDCGLVVSIANYARHCAGSRHTKMLLQQK